MPAEIRLANITFILSMSLQLRQFWIMCPTYYLLLVPFYTVLSQILALTDAGISHRPTCPNQPDSRVATRPLPRPLYFWYLVQFETCIVVTEYCPCESIKHQVVKRRFIGSIPSRQLCWNVKSLQNRFEGTKDQNRGCVKRLLREVQSSLSVEVAWSWVAVSSLSVVRSTNVASSWDVESRQGFSSLNTANQLILVERKNKELFRSRSMGWCEIGFVLLDPWLWRWGLSR